jgi:hypothetical protein
MPPPLVLRVADPEGDLRWRWVLEDDRGTYLADHEVRLDPAAREVEALRDLPAYLDRYSVITPPAELLAELGAWMGPALFGNVGAVLADRAGGAATPVRVLVPDGCENLLRFPLELAHFGGQPVAQAGVRLLYESAAARPPRGDGPARQALRVLAVFSLPHGEQPLALRRERVGLVRALRRLAQTRSAAIESRVLQYGATRTTLREALLAGDGWDLIHFSGHGLAGELVLEDERGEPREIGADELVALLRPAREHLKLLTLSSCLSGAASLAEARRAVGLPAFSAGEDRVAGAAPQALVEAPVSGERAALAAVSALPSLGQRLAGELDTAVLAMRYSVGDDFARELVLRLYDLLLKSGQPLPGALHFALEEVLGGADGGRLPPLSLATPVLFGRRAADLKFALPRRPAEFALPETGLFGFEPEPERFVGRLLPMLRASQALAPESLLRGVLFHGMAGGGKSTCAQELAYRHERDRFTGYAWYRAPEEGRDVATALVDFAQALERQLEGLALVGLVDDPEVFRHKALPRLKARLEESAILLVLDNLESLLSEAGTWRDDRWGDLVATLLSHRGFSRVVLTSRWVPQGLEDHPAHLHEPVFALSFPESVVLARELPHLARLFESEAGVALLRRVLAAAQGHPKLLELAEGLLGTDPAELERQLAAAEGGGEAAARGSFLSTGESAQGPAAFVRTLEAWTTGIAAGLPPAARLLFHFLCCLEEEDRHSGVVEAVWEHFLDAVKEQVPAAAQALAEPGHGLTAGLDRLAAVGLVEVQARPGPAEGLPVIGEAAPRSLRLHPAVAETGRREAGEGVSAAVDRELAGFYGTMLALGVKKEAEGAGQVVVTAGLRAAPYLLRAARWEVVSRLLEQALLRDHSPSTLARALPLVRSIAEATRGTEREGIDQGVLAWALVAAGRSGEGEGIMRQALERSAAAGRFRLASAIASDLVSLLRATSRFDEALAVLERAAEYTASAGLGPWTRLADQAQRLQVLHMMGRHGDVLSEVEGLEDRMAKLSEKGAGEEAVRPWNVREAILEIGSLTARELGRWDEALRLNEAVLRSRIGRGAGELELARTRFNDYGPLLRLRSFAEVRKLLEACRRTFERERDWPNLGKTFGALADLENEEAHPAEAARFEGVALRYSYQAGEPAACSVSHNNLANCLKKAGAEAALVLAHRLADALICFQSRSGTLSTTMRNLARSALPPTPPPFDEVASRVEAWEGVRFRELYARLPQRAPDGDAALAEIWRLVEAEAERQREEQARLRAAIERHEPAEQRSVLERLQGLGLLAGAPGGPSAPPDPARLRREFDPLLRGIAAVARGFEEPRSAIEAVLSDLESKGWHLADPVQRIWAGERDAGVLTAGLDASDSFLIGRLLELVEQPTPEEVLEGAPESVRRAIEAGDVPALQSALAALPPAEAQQLFGLLQQAGILSSASE